MIDTVFTADGDTYERSAIEEWLKEHDTNPKTNKKLEHKGLVLNRQLKSANCAFRRTIKCFNKTCWINCRTKNYGFTHHIKYTRVA